MKFPPRGRATAIAAALMVVLGGLSLGAPAQAYEVATAPPANVTGGAAVLTMPGSGLTTTYDQSGLTYLAGRTTLDSRGYVASDYSQGVPPAALPPSSSGRTP